MNLDLIIAIIIAGLSFTLCFGLSSPSLYLEDEWITVNQVHQLISQGSLLENEGKYGSYYTGEVSGYFLARNNYLAYSLFLPVISLPAMNFILLSGDNFRFLFLIFWAFVVVITLLCTLFLSSKLGYRNYYYLTWLCFLFFIGFFFLNLYYYHPYPTGADRPIESAAVIFSNEVLFSFIPTMIFGFFRNLKFNRISSVFASIVIVCCSTYMYWSTCAKDHLLVAFLLMALIFISSLLVKQQSGIKWLVFFLIAGLICWVRPEYGIVLLFGLCALVFLFFLNNFIKDRNSMSFCHNFRYLLWAIAGLSLGMCPFFINNLLITGNLLIPPQYLYIASVDQYQLFDVFGNGHELGVFGEILLYLNQISSFFMPRIDTIPTDFYGLFISPPNGAVGILFISPIVIPAFLYWILTGKKDSSNYSIEVKKISIFIIFLILLTFMAYLRTLHSSIMSPGSFPDMRYFSPLYLLTGIVSYLTLSPIFNLNPIHFLKTVIAGLLFIPCLIIILIFAFPFGIDFLMYTSLLKKVLIMDIAVLFIFGMFFRRFWRSNWIFPITFTIMVMIPAMFQIMMVFIFSYAKINGYYFWLPLFEFLFTDFIRLIY